MVGDSICIGTYNAIQGSQHNFKIATVFGKMDLIVLWKTPKSYWNILEGEIEEILTHESLHIILSNFLGQEISDAFDKICPHTRSMTLLWKMLGRKRTRKMQKETCSV
jgi:hypothetical protein